MRLCAHMIFGVSSSLWWGHDFVVTLPTDDANVGSFCLNSSVCYSLPGGLVTLSLLVPSQEGKPKFCPLLHSDDKDSRRLIEE